MRRFVVLGALFLALFSTTPLTDEGRIPLFQPTTITDSGSYVVTRNIMFDVCPPGPDPVLSILAAADIDLNGFNVDNTCGGPAIQGTGFKIHNGSVGTGGIRSDGGIVVLDDLSVYGSITLNTPFQYALTDLFAGAVSVNDLDPNFPQQGKIENSQIASLFLAGLTNVAVRNNRLGTLGFGLGINFPWNTRCVIADNTIQSGFRFFCDSGQIVRNSMGGSTLEIAGNRNQVSDNILTGTTGVGMMVTGDQNSIDGNLISGSTSFGLLFTAAAGANVYRGNVARGNTGAAGPLCAAPCSPDFCNVGVGNSSSSTNFLPGPPGFPACI